MVRAAKMEIAIIDKKYQVIFHQVLKGFTQLLLINKAIGPQAPSEALICKLALSTLDKNTEYFMTGNCFHLTDESLSNGNNSKHKQKNKKGKKDKTGVNSST
jgi:hypothetical protein